MLLYSMLTKAYLSVFSIVRIFLLKMLQQLFFYKRFAAFQVADLTFTSLSSSTEFKNFAMIQLIGLPSMSF